jgi:hypothetical protein
VVGIPIQERHLQYEWDGAKVGRYFDSPFQVRSATVQHRQHGGVNGRGKGRGQGL